jgi:hypothetical protein
VETIPTLEQRKLAKPLVKRPLRRKTNLYASERKSWDPTCGNVFVTVRKMSKSDAVLITKRSDATELRLLGPLSTNNSLLDLR